MSTWNALTGLPSIFLRQDWLKFSLLHQYHNALGRLESTPSKKRAFLCSDAIFLNGNWIIIIFFIWAEALGASPKIRDLGGEVSVGGYIDGRTRGSKIINGVHQPEGSAVHWKTSECWPPQLSQHTERFWTKLISGWAQLQSSCAILKLKCYWSSWRRVNGLIKQQNGFLEVNHWRLYCLVSFHK